MTFQTDKSHIEAMLDTVPDRLFVMAPSTSNIVHCNRAAHAELGYERQELQGHSVLSLQKDVPGSPQWNQIAQAMYQYHHSLYRAKASGRNTVKATEELALKAN